MTKAKARMRAKARAAAKAAKPAGQGEEPDARTGPARADAKPDIVRNIGAGAANIKSVAGGMRRGSARSR